MIKILENFILYPSFRLKVIVLIILILLIIGASLYFILRKDKIKCKIGIIIFMIFVVVIGIAGLFTIKVGVKELDNKQKYEKLVKNDILYYVPGIVCWGDSLTAGADSDYPPYPAMLKEKINDKYSKITDTNVSIVVQNMGVGGENAANIVGRSGNIPFTLTAFTMPQDTVPIEVSFEQIHDFDTRFGWYTGGLAGVNPCTVLGIEGKIGLEEQIDGTYKYYFTRSEVGQSVDVPKGTELVTYATDKWTDFITIVFIGANGGYRDIEDLIYLQHAIIDNMDEENDRYLVITTTGENIETHKEEEEACRLEYGDKYLNLREYLCSEAIYDVGLIPTEQDLEDISNGVVPTSLRKDKIHYNEYGTRAVANKVYEKLNELGYFADLDKWCESIQ